ncbi:MAG: iron-siderophore ABC transporter substrate-binding protein [Pseudonocardia sp.]
MTTSLNRRQLLGGAAAAGLLAACSSTPSAGSGATGSGGGFPVTITHKFGDTVIPKAPERVFSVGYNDQDSLLALGVTPVGVREWFGNFPYATHPWATDLLGDAQPEVMTGDEVNFELVAKTRPDLIVGQYAFLAEEDYAKLAQIAPTISQDGAYIEGGMPWQEMHRTTGRALGREDQAERTIAEVEARFAQARRQHPEFQGLGAFLEPADPGSYYALGPQDPRARFLADLGFEVPPEITTLAGDQFYAQISGEQLRLADRDVLVWLDYESTGQAVVLQEDPVYQTLGVAREGRSVFPDVPLRQAIAFSSVLSLPVAIDGLVPLLAAAADGDPATTATSGG